MNSQTIHPEHKVENLLLSAALDYAERGLPVFPVWPIKDGKCSCREVKCERPGKHPIGDLARKGRNSATTDPETIKRWWGKCPDANIGIPTGPESGLVVVDVDPRNGGDQSFQKLPGIMPLTPTVHTGGGGEHYFFLHPGNGQKIKSKPELGGFPGIDQKGNGGYIVAPPSNHVSGGSYSWKVSPDSTPLATIPDWLINLLTQDKVPCRQSGEKVGGKLPEGKRNSTLASLAGTMRRRGMSQEAIEAALLAENNMCSPKFTDAEVLSIARSISSYAPGNQGAATGGAWLAPEPLRRPPDPGRAFPSRGSWRSAGPGGLGHECNYQGAGSYLWSIGVGHS